MKRKMFCATSLLLSVSLLFLLFTGCGSSGSTPSASQSPSATESTAPVEVRTLKLGHAMSEAHSWHIASQKFADLIKERTNGAIEIEIYPNSQLGDKTQMIESAQLGVVDIILSAPANTASFVPEVAMLDLPFLFRDYDHAFKALDTVVMDNFADKFEDIGLILLCHWNTGFKSLSNSKCEIKSIDDIKGMKIRVAGNPALIEAVTAMGANAITIPWSETYIALQQGTADAQFNPPSAIVEAKLQEVQKYFSPNLVIQYGAEQVIMSQKTWDSLTPEQQEIFITTANEVGEFQRTISVKADDDALQVMKDSGCVVTDVPDEVVEQLTGILTPLQEKYGDPELIAEIKAIK